MAITVDIQKKLGDFQLDIQFQSSSRRIGILGASGCGKSMTLKSIAGIETPAQGKICVDDKILYDSAQKMNVKPQKRNIGYLFQNYALFPTMTVAKNIETGLKCSKAEKQKRVQEMLHKFQLDGLADHLPGQLSGGQQQRVALARIMAYEPDMILLDEPFSALDVFLKDRLQLEMEEMLSDYKGTVILVSHSRDEVYRFCEELLIMDAGKVVTYGKTKEIFAYPEYKEAARLTGCKNFSSAQRIDAHTIEAKDWGIELKVEQEIPEDCTCLGYRAHYFKPVWGEREENCLKVQVASVAKMPFETFYYLRPENDSDTVICWFVQKDEYEALEEKGVPDYLKFDEKGILFLK
ncbi:MAG: sulfate/molybdate ABC transporter ATP-binding protein [Ruminococcus sp.]|nr:sulfate/molybdate ABC transporter ATP-binding protein [Ruminococcus sp.]